MLPPKEVGAWLAVENLKKPTLWRNATPLSPTNPVDTDALHRLLLDEDDRAFDAGDKSPPQLPTTRDFRLIAASESVDRDPGAWEVDFADIIAAEQHDSADRWHLSSLVRGDESWRHEVAFVKGAHLPQRLGSSSDVDRFRVEIRQGCLSYDLRAWILRRDSSAGPRRSFRLNLRTPVTGRPAPGGGFLSRLSQLAAPQEAQGSILFHRTERPLKHTLPPFTLASVRNALRSHSSARSSAAFLGTLRRGYFEANPSRTVVVVRDR